MKPTQAMVLAAVLLGLLAIPNPAQSESPEAASKSLGLGGDAGPEVVNETGLNPSNEPSIFRDESQAVEVTGAKDDGESLPDRYLVQSVPWLTPDYSRQEGAIGWQADAFKVPASMQKRVQFWKDIYAKYTTSQGLIHDVEDLTIVYEALDLTAIPGLNKLSPRRRTRARNRYINERRTQIVLRLERIAKAKKEKDLKDDEDRRYLSFFTKESPSALFLPGSKKSLEAVRKKIRLVAKKRRVRFQLGQRDRFILGVYYSGRYLRKMEKYFHAERLPIELTRLPFVESSFNLLARSYVGASGIWQFMPRTAKPGMMVNRDIDERNDPMTATVAAARLMRSNFEQLRSWPLALTAYNHGAKGVLRAVRKVGSRDLAVIIEKYEHRRFGFASSNFYACFLAALEVEHQARALLGDVKWSLEFDGAEIPVRKPLPWATVVKFYDGEKALAELQNPHVSASVRKGRRPIPVRTFIRVPSARSEVVKEFLDGKLSDDDLRIKMAGFPIPRSYVSGSATGEHESSTQNLKQKLGSMSESATALLPFLAVSPSPVPSPTPSPSSKVQAIPAAPDGGDGLPPIPAPGESK